MKILVITQEISRQSPVLGFFHGWLAAFSKRFESITAVCLKKGDYDLPANVSVFSLGKEDGRSRLKYVWNFFRLIIGKRSDYDAVFVHMNAEYVLLGFLIWRILGKKIVIWYNHTLGGVKPRMAFLLADRVCHTSPFAFSAGRRKSVRMPAGVDTDVFKPAAIARDTRSILYVGRLSPLKKVDLLVRACEELHAKGVGFKLNIYGEAPVRDKTYTESLVKIAEPLLSAGKARFYGSVPNSKTPEIYSANLICVNLTPKGNYDKTVPESMACGAIPLVSSRAFSEIVPEKFFFKEDDVSDLSRRLAEIFTMPISELDRNRQIMRARVVENESLSVLSLRLKDLFGSLWTTKR